MAINSVPEFNRIFLDQLPAETINEAAELFACVLPNRKKTTDKLTKQGPHLLNFILYEFDIPASNLKKAAKALSIDVSGFTKDEIIAHLRKILPEMEEAVRKGRSLSNVNTTSAESQDSSAGMSLDGLWEEAERVAKSVLLLKARKSGKTSKKPIAVWNPKLPSKMENGLWFRIDMRKHPDPKLCADGVLDVDVAPYGPESTATLNKGQSLKINKGERPLYAEEAWDFPCQEILETKAKKSIREALANDSELLSEYDSAWWVEANPRDIFTHTAVYAQLGGWNIGWPDESIDEQQNKRLIVRTYQNAEPWIEVFRVGRKYEVSVRIT
ncbi:hypothetical protein [Gimesia aquarii]|uniref:Uncharacterized protein n=1 Tax=Gimesia aquarii TaxID=2527964 RepID=A0A517W2S5_9PLAN|nr:hypothetical protein [Gimesia aquarii]QDT99549.1 hypothetical protein V144x_50610 [Gimesia aquarii]